jgi:5'-nucleotidase
VSVSFRLFSRLLLTNDDGIDALGLRTLTEVAEELAGEVWIVAPDYDQSGTSHSLSLHAPLRVSQKDERRYSVSGTPGDCVVMAVRHLMGSRRPDLILSGINRGANLGIETVFSGTVGAAMTGLLLGIPSMALSQAYTDRTAVRWDTARAVAPKVIMQFARGAWSQGSILNINFPDVPVDEVGPIELTTQGTGLIDDVEVISAVDPRSLEYHWLSLRRSARQDPAGSETFAVGQGRISVTPLQFERTNQSILASLKAG